MKRVYKNILLSAVTTTTLVTPIITLSSCACTQQEDEKTKKMEVEELTESKAIIGDSDKGYVYYKFNQKKLDNYKNTIVKLVSLTVHGKTETVENNLIKYELKSNGQIDVQFDTQLFIKNHLAKYYGNDNSDPQPSTYKFELTNLTDGTKFVSSEYSLTITPAKYKIAFTTPSEQLHLPQDATVNVYRQYSGTYTIDNKYKITKQSLLRYDGQELFGEPNVKFDNGEIYIPADYVTGPIIVSAQAEYGVCDIHGYGNAIFNLPEYVWPNEKITGTYTMNGGYTFKKGYVFCGENLVDEKLFKIADGNIEIDPSAVTDEISVIITSSEKYTVTPLGDHVTYSELPKEVDEKTAITGKYTIAQGYEIDNESTYVMVNGTKLDSGYTIANGNISIESEKVIGDVTIYIGTKEISKTYKVEATGDMVVGFPKTIPDAIENKEYKLTYQAKYGTLNTIEVKVGTSTLTRDTDYSCKDGLITIFANKITDKVTIKATGTPASYGKVTYDIDDRISYEGTEYATFGTDIVCKLHAEVGYLHITNYGCAVHGDETFTQYLQWDEDNKILTLPGKYVQGSVKIWASVA